MTRLYETEKHELPLISLGNCLKTNELVMTVENNPRASDELILKLNIKFHILFQKDYV